MAIPKNAKLTSFRTLREARTFAKNKLNMGYEIEVAKGDHYFVVYWKPKWSK